MEELYGSFVDDLLKQKGIEATPEQRESLFAYIDQEVDKALLEALPMEQLDKLEAATREGTVNDNTIEQLADEAGLDLQSTMKEILENIRDDFLKEERQ